MAKEKNNPPEEEANGAPEWMVTFSDCMTLLLTFFVLLLSFASFEKHTIPALGLSFAKALPSVGDMNVNRMESIYEKQASDRITNPNEGTETKTNADAASSNYMREKKPLDFRNLKVFSVSSENFFWGQGNAISKEGRIVLEALAKFMKNTTGRVVISENGPEGNESLGLSRSIAVMEYLTKKEGLPEDRFSITSSTTMKSKHKGRRLEITLLERNIYE